MKRISLVIWLMCILTGCLSSDHSRHPSETIEEDPVETCVYQNLSSAEFVLGQLNDYDKQRYGYFHLYLAPNRLAAKVPYAEFVGHHGRVTDEIIYNEDGSTFRKAVLDNCQIIYIAVYRSAPYALSQIEKSGVYLLKNEDKLNNTRAELAKLIGKPIYVKAPMGKISLLSEHGEKVMLAHGTEVIVKDVVLDALDNSLYLLVKYQDSYLKFNYENGYYLQKPSIRELKRDRVTNLDLLSLAGDFILSQFDHINNSSSRKVELFSLYFPIGNQMLSYRQH